MDYTNSVQVAARGFWEGRSDTGWESLTPIVQHSVMEHVLPVVEALGEAGLLKEGK